MFNDQFYDCYGKKLLMTSRMWLLIWLLSVLATVVSSCSEEAHAANLLTFRHKPCVVGKPLYCSVYWKLGNQGQVPPVHCMIHKWSISWIMSPIEEGRCADKSLYNRFRLCSITNLRNWDGIFPLLASSGCCRMCPEGPPDCPVQRELFHWNCCCWASTIRVSCSCLIDTGFFLSSCWDLL